MSKYTTEVRFICEQAAGLDSSTGFGTVNQILQAAAPKVFNFDFPIWDENYRIELECKILRHYYTREIGLETVGLWKLHLDTKMNEIMPIANKLYSALAEEFSIFDDVNYTRNIDNTGNDTTTDNRTEYTSVEEKTGNQSTGSSQNINKYSATPQGGLTGVMDDEYLTNATVDNGTVNSSDDFTRELTDYKGKGGSVKVNRQGNVVETVKGKMNSGKTYAQILKEWDEARINVDMMVIKSLSDLFMNVW